MRTYDAGKWNAVNSWMPEAIRLAIATRQLAWVPVTGVRVGAVVAVRRGTDVELSSACNIEMSTSIELHAEDTAVRQMIVRRGFNPREPIIACVIAYLATLDAHHVFPCGNCRQILHEFGGPGLVVYGLKLASDDAKEPAIVERGLMNELLPYAFTPKHFRDISQGNGERQPHVVPGE